MASPPRVPDELLHMLRCPRTHSCLQRADEQLVQRANRAIATRSLANQVGERLTQPLCGGLVNEGQSLLYPVYEHGPTLVVDEAISLPLRDEPASAPTQESNG